MLRVGHFWIFLHFFKEYKNDFSLKFYNEFWRLPSFLLSPRINQWYKYLEMPSLFNGILRFLSFENPVQGPFYHCLVCRTEVAWIISQSRYINRFVQVKGPWLDYLTAASATIRRPLFNETKVAQRKSHFFSQKCFWRTNHYFFKFFILINRLCFYCSIRFQTRFNSWKSLCRKIYSERRSTWLAKVWR